jgi:uncharacterized repeat protein (TIGR01451 family)
MRALLPLILVVANSVVFAQAPGVVWQQTIGGENNDLPSFSMKTIDNQIITIGSTYSSTGIYSSNHGSPDIWVEKHDLQGILQWRKLLGGTGVETPVNYYYNSDGSLMILSTSTSNDGDVTGNHGLKDIWIVKLDALGSLVWQKSFGGSNNENAGNIIKTTDGNYVVSGTSSSNNGDLTANAGDQDVWMFKIDDSGIIQWQNSFGGSGREVSNNIKAIEGSDGSIYFLTETGSNNGNVSGNNGSTDMWLVKSNSSGVLQWQLCLGGAGAEYSVDLKQLANGDLYAIGNTNSSFPSFHGYSDFYVTRVTSAGTLVWQKCFGGTLDDVPLQIVSTENDESVVLSGYVNNGGGDVVGYQGYAVGSSTWVLKVSGVGDIIWQQVLNASSVNGFADDGQIGIGGAIKTNDAGYLVAAFSGQGSGKTNFHTPALYDSSGTDIWMVKLTSSGTIDWERCFGGYRGDLPRGLPIELSNNEYFVTAATNSSDGDIYVNYGKWDNWLLRLGAVNRIKGTVFVDNNLNGTKDVGEPFYSDVLVKTKSSTDSAISIPYGGHFVNEVTTGNYTTTVTPNLPYFNVVPSSFSNSYSTYFNTDSISFALQPISNVQDLVVSIIPVIPARPGFAASYRVFYKNAGTTTISSGQISFIKDSRTTLLSSSPTASSPTGDLLVWNYSNFAPGDTASILITLHVAVPPTVNVGDTLSYSVIIDPVSGDVTPMNDSAILKQRVVGSFDPNDKTENNGGVITSDFISNGSYLQYTVRFQNTGTADAYNVTVRDTLGDRVDLSTLEMVSVSHPYSLSIENGNQLVWQFDNIMLPPSSVDEPGSHGYIVYRIKPKSDVAVGETIHNTASIYFDYNLPVLTNDATTLVKDNSVILPLQLLSFTGQLTNSNVQLHWNVSNATNFERFEVERSIDGHTYSRTTALPFNTSVSVYNAIDNVAGLSANTVFYRLKLIDADGHYTYSKVVVFKINTAGGQLFVYPNPAKTELFVSFTANTPGNLQVKIVDASGRILTRVNNAIQKGNNIFPVNISALKAGSYILELSENGKTKISKFTIMN